MSTPGLLLAVVISAAVANDKMPDASGPPAVAKGAPLPRSGLRAWDEALQRAGLRLYGADGYGKSVVAGLALTDAVWGEPCHAAFAEPVERLAAAADRASGMLAAAGWPHDRADIRVHAVLLPG